MKFTVVWTAAAEHQLGAIWLASSDRQRIAEAADRLDVVLGQTPLVDSVINEENSRDITLLPLTVRFNVSEDDRLVTVYAIWRR